MVIWDEMMMRGGTALLAAALTMFGLLKKAIGECQSQGNACAPRKKKKNLKKCIYNRRKIIIRVGCALTPL